MKFMKIKSIIAALLCAFMLTACSAQQDISSSDSSTSTISETSSKPQAEIVYKYQKYASMSAKEITSSLTLEQKAAHMVQPAVYAVNKDLMKKNDYGSILSKLSNFDYKQ